MKNVMSVCLVLLFSLLPGLSLAHDGSNEEQANAQFINEISQATG